MPLPPSKGSKAGVGGGGSVGDGGEKGGKGADGGSEGEGESLAQSAHDRKIITLLQSELAETTLRLGDAKDQVRVRSGYRVQGTGYRV